jgi:hypothetical protein
VLEMFGRVRLCTVPHCLRRNPLFTICVGTSRNRGGRRVIAMSNVVSKEGITST